jgi:septum formation protein
MLVLASASPRRRELLALLGMPFTVVPSRFEEPPAPAAPVSLPELVISLAAAKALEVARRLGDNKITVIGADTLVTLSHSDTGVPLGKPGDTRGAAQMLALLAGNTHFVYTGLALAVFSDGGSRVLASTSERTGVTFRELNSTMIDNYVETGEPLDKAGAYGAQGYAAPFIESFDGDFYNVVGLPLCSLGNLLESCGIVWWNHRSSMPQIIG